jgi:hypothetical protein
MPASDPNAAARTTASSSPSPGPGPNPGWAKRIGWLLLIWCASVAALGAAAMGLRLLMGLLGMSR